MPSGSIRGPVTRRGFLAALAAGLVLDPERALWVPGKKLISIPGYYVPLPVARGLGSAFGGPGSALGVLAPYTWVRSTPVSVVYYDWRP